MAASRFAFDQAASTGEAGLFALASKLADASRQNLLAAHELCAREAKARPALNPTEALARALAEESDAPLVRTPIALPAVAGEPS